MEQGYKMEGRDIMVPNYLLPSLLVVELAAFGSKQLSS
jgi:hypothetical protein